MTRAFLDIKSKASSGRVVVELFDEKAPRAVENFLALCKGVERDGRQLCYKNTQFHRVVAPEFLVQGGDMPGTIFGGHFEDENLGWNGLEEPGYLCMANENTPNTNGSQFFITLVPTPWLKNSVTVFGRVIRGMAVIAELYKVKVDDEDRPLPGEEVAIERCGEVLYRKKQPSESQIPQVSKEPEPQLPEELDPSTNLREHTKRNKHDKFERRDSHGRRDTYRSERQESGRLSPPKKPRMDDGGVILKGRGKMKYEERRSQYRTR
ncbi:hypothetical protein TRVA0_004S03730 [Trichomonascus vanleenenianus]|uniref:peptidylprolyl isomerase n=1 Tax=Trichomonascus vanleenenianus TaxID=2268995 RepID=UPI003EC990D9